MKESRFETLHALMQMESKDIALLFYETGFETFYAALSGCNQSLQASVLANVSHRTREIMQEELKLRASPDPIFVDQALEEITLKALALAGRGLIQIPLKCLEVKSVKALIDKREKRVKGEELLAKLEELSTAMNVLLNNSNQNRGN